MSHYTKNVQSLLTGGFKVLNVIFKSKFIVKDKTKELCFFDNFYRCFSQKNVRVLEKNVLLMEMNTDRHVGGELEAFLRHPLLNAVNVFPLTHKAKSPTNKEQSVPFKKALTMLLILMLKRAGDRMLPCGTPISCSCSSERVEPTLTLKERSDRKL